MTNTAVATLLPSLLIFAKPLPIVLTVSETLSVHVASPDLSSNYYVTGIILSIYTYYLM